MRTLTTEPQESSADVARQVHGGAIGGFVRRDLAVHGHAPLNTLALLVPTRVGKLLDRWDWRIALAALLLVSGAEA
ncbi:hypothetical protein [Streptomyces sp. NPDC001275]